MSGVRHIVVDAIYIPSLHLDSQSLPSSSSFSYPSLPHSTEVARSPLSLCEKKERSHSCTAATHALRHVRSTSLSLARHRDDAHHLSHIGELASSFDSGSAIAVPPHFFSYAKQLVFLSYREARQRNSHFTSDFVHTIVRPRPFSLSSRAFSPAADVPPCFFSLSYATPSCPRCSSSPLNSSCRSSLDVVCSELVARRPVSSCEWKEEHYGDVSRVKNPTRQLIGELEHCFSVLQDILQDWGILEELYRF